MAKGILPADDTDDTDEAVARVVNALRTSVVQEPELMPEAVEMLLAAASIEGPHQGLITFMRSNLGMYFTAGQNRGPFNDPKDMRSVAKYQHALQQLEDGGLVEARSQTNYRLTYDGYLLADELAARGAQPLPDEQGK